VNVTVLGYAAYPSLSSLASEVSTPPGRFVFGSNTMSNLIPSLETFAKAGRHSTSLRSHTSSDTALCSAAWGFFFSSFFQAVFYMDCGLMVGFFVAYLRGRQRRLRDWARWVIVCPSFEFISMNDHPRRNGPALLWPELSHLPQCIPSRRTGECVTSPCFRSSSSDQHA
jgi:hypothetical protein